MKNKFRDYYADLGLEPGASLSAIKSAFFALAKQHHPDKSGNPDSTVFRQVREAFDNLSHPDLRTIYDATYKYDKRRAGLERAEEEALKAKREEVKRSSPPPEMPYKNRPGKAGWSIFSAIVWKSFLEEDAAWRARHPELYYSDSISHGMLVRMADHPASEQSCATSSEDWCLQSDGQGTCIFCLDIEPDCSRCPERNALACSSCHFELTRLEAEADKIRWGPCVRPPYFHCGG